MPVSITIEVLQEILKLYRNGSPPFKIAEILRLSSQTVCKKLRSSGYPKCIICGKKLDNSRLSRLYCDECSRRVMSKNVMDYYKRRKDLEMSSLASKKWCDREIMETHGDMHNLNSSVYNVKVKAEVSDKNGNNTKQSFDYIDVIYPNKKSRFKISVYYGDNVPYSIKCGVRVVDYTK